MKNILLFILIIAVFTTCKKKQADPVPLPISTLGNGLMGNFTFTGNANDGSLNGYNGAIVNATLTSDRFGTPNAAYNFTGSDSYIGFGNVMNNLFGGSGKIFSFSAWIKPNNAMSNNVIIAKNSDTGCGENQREIVFRIYSNKLNFTYFGALAGGYARYISGSTDITNTSKWYHVVVIYDGNINTVNDGLDRVKMFVDKTQESLSFVVASAGTLQDIQSGTAHLGIGNYLTSTGTSCQTGTSFNGKIDDVRIYNRALTLSEISELYNVTN